MAQKIGIAFCCERGELERTTMVMVKSLYKYGGLTDDIKLFCFCPRPLFRPGASTLREFHELGIEVVDLPLNTRYSFYPLINKVVSLKYLEESTNLDRLIFLDSDLIIFDKVIDEELLNYDVSLQTEFLDLITCANSNDSNYPFWDRLFKEFEIKNKSYTNTFVSGKRIFSYWNSGLISYKRELFIGSKWYNNLVDCFSKYHWRKLAYYFLEQATLAITLLQHEVSVHQLSPGFNYPISFHNDIISGNKIDKFNQLHIVHYLRETDKSLDVLRKFEQGRRKVEWIEQIIKLYELNNKSLFRKIKDSFYSIRKSNLQKLIYFSNRFSGRIK